MPLAQSACSSRESHVGRVLATARPGRGRRVRRAGWPGHRSDCLLSGVDPGHRVIDWGPGDRCRLVLGRGQLIECLGGTRSAAVGQVRRGERGAAARRVEKPVAAPVGAVVAAPPPWAESCTPAFLSLTSRMPRIRPTAIMTTKGTAISMNRPLGAPDADQCLGIESTSMLLLRLPRWSR
jgi:hypothetical protein